MLASRMTVVSDAHAAARLQRAYPLPASASRRWEWAVQGPARPGLDPGLGRERQGLTPIVGALDSSRTRVIQRAFARARDAGA